MNKIAPIGHNNPPDPIDTICAAYEDARVESENWLDGSPVENEAQMTAVSALREDMRQFRLNLDRGLKDATAPFNDALKAERARWKPVLDDVERIEKGLVAAVDGFKRRLAAEKAEVERKAWAEAEAKRREVEVAAQAAAVSDIGAQREVAAKRAEAEAAMAAADAAKRDTVKGLRTVQHHEVENYGAAINDIATHDKPAIRAFVDEYARRNFKTRAIAGVRVWSEKEAF